MVHIFRRLIITLLSLLLIHQQSMANTFVNGTRVAPGSEISFSQENRAEPYLTDQQIREQLQQMELYQRMMEGRATSLDVNERVFVFKHFKTGAYEFAPETMAFIMANIIVTYGRCYGLNAAESIYKATNVDPMCVQNLMDMITSPIFYAGFFAFMIGSRYATPAAMNMFKQLDQWKQRRSTTGRHTPMPYQRVQFWAGQIGMAFGFMADQVFHKIAENHLMKECVKHTLGFVESGDEQVDTQAMQNGEDRAELRIFSHPSCLQGYRELFRSSQATDTFVPALGGLLLSAYINGRVTPPILAAMGIAAPTHAAAQTARATSQVLVPRLINSGGFYGAAPQFQWALTTGANGAVRAGAIGRALFTVGNLTGFLAISQILAYIIDPNFVRTTSVIRFRNQIKNLNESFSQYVNDDYYDEEVCPHDYQQGELTSATGLCSRVPSVPQLRTFHSHQKAWRQNHILQKFNMAYHGWMAKWNNFHRGYMATKETLKEISQFREHRFSGTVQSLQENVETLDTRFEEKLDEVAERTGRDKEELREIALYLYESGSVSPDVDENHLAFIYFVGQSSQDEIRNFEIENPLYFVGQDEETPNIEFVSGVIDEIFNIFDRVRRRALRTLPMNERSAYIRATRIVNGDVEGASQGRIDRAQRYLDEFNERLDEIERDTWIDINGATSYFGGFSRQHIPRQSPLDPEQDIDYLWAKRVINDYREALENPQPNDTRLDNHFLSYAFLTLQKYARIHPITPEKEEMTELLRRFRPLYKYRKVYESRQADFATIQGYQKPYVIALDEAGGDESQVQITSPRSADERPETFWNSAPEPLRNSDLYDYVLTSTLCNGDERFVVNANEGFAMEFNAPLLTNADQKICDRAVYLDTWMSRQLGFSPKSSLFLDSDDFVSRGLTEIAIYDNSILYFMNNEADFSNWWNDNIYQEAVHVVRDMGQRYYSMMNDKLLNKISRNAEDLELAILGQQSHTEWNYTGWFLLDGSVEWAYYYRDFYRDLVNGWIDRETEHSNFKQSEDLFEAFASEFGLLSNYLAVTLQKLGEGDGAREASAQANDPSQDPLIIEDSFDGVSLNSSLSQRELFTDPVGAFLPEALQSSPDQNLTENLTDTYVQELSESIKNIKLAFLHVLETWDSVNISNYYEKKEALEVQLNRLASLIVPVDNALDMVKVMQARADQDIYINTTDRLAYVLLQRKPAMVILNAMADIIEEVHMLRSMRTAENFDFNLEGN